MHHAKASPKHDGDGVGADNGNGSQTRTQMEDNDELKMAWAFIEKTGANLFLTGKAGTGKTTFLRHLRCHSPKRMVVLAPTGIAAINAGGTTIHSFFQLPLSPYVPGATFGGNEKRHFRFGKVKRDIIKTLDLLVIDEISMVRADLLDAVDSVMRRYRYHDKPFGGAQLLLIGDLQQLAPVVKDDEWELMKPYYETPFFFSSKALNMTPYHAIELQRVYRQQDDRFLAMLNKIRENRADDATLAELNRRYRPGFVPPRDGDYIRLVTHNSQAQAVNDRELSELPTGAVTYRAEIEGDFPEHMYPADRELTLKPGAQVMFIKNATDKSYYNGMIGRVEHADTDCIRVRDKVSGRVLELSPTEWTNSRYTLDDKTKEITEAVEGVFRQYPLRLAWAITIHKSQGLTFEHAIIDASHSFAHGQTYVALSRCKSLDGLVLSAPLSRETVISDAAVDSFIGRATANRPTAATLTKLQREYVSQTLDELFGLDMLRQAVEAMARTLSEHFFNKCHTLLTEYAQATRTLAEMAGVAARFAEQYRSIIANGTDADNATLQERIHKGAAYFAKQLEPMAALFAKTHVETGNKAAKKQFDDRHAQLGEELAFKINMLGYESSAGVTFSTGDYLRHKALALLGKDDGRTLGRKAAKSTLAGKAAPIRKSSTREVSHDMFTGGMTVAQIAEQRRLTVSTVFRHLAQYVKEDKLPIDQLVPQEHIDMIRNHARMHPDRLRSSEIKEALGDAVSYDEIWLVANVFDIDRTANGDTHG